MIPLKFSSLIFVRDTSRGRHFERALLELIAHFQLEDRKTVKGLNPGVISKG